MPHGLAATTFRTQKPLGKLPHPTGGLPSIAAPLSEGDTLSDQGIKQRLGATRLPNGCWEFLLWAPRTRTASVHILGDGEKLIPMEALERGYFKAVAENLDAEARYLYRLNDGRELPDPASRFQPEGVHGPSQLFDTAAFRWTDQNWQGRSLESSIFYELHVGTFTADGTFAGAMKQLAYLASLGVTTIEFMPIAQFPGARNWGYDGVYPFAPQTSYGTPESLQRFIDAAHAHGLGVALDVVYNHLGPEGNYLNVYGPYFTDRYHTPWGDAINYDGAGSDEVRRFFIANALHWLEDYHFDALRLDAIHGIFDFGAQHFLAELKLEVSQLSKRAGRQIHLIAESDLNDSRVLRCPEQGGYGLDAQWSDDFHHAVHTLLTNENQGYYADFEGIEPLLATLKDGWFYSGQYSDYRQRQHGNSPRGIAPSKFVVCNQNHDQIGNRAAGDRLAPKLNFEAIKLAAGITLLSPFVPLLFMGEEYGETAPFQYFTSHGDPALVGAVRKGRSEEFAAFGWTESVPDPQSDSTFTRSKLNHSLKEQASHSVLLRFYRELIKIRRQFDIGALSSRSVDQVGDRAVLLILGEENARLAIVFNFSESEIAFSSPKLGRRWKTILNSADSIWNEPNTNSLENDASSASRELRVSPQSLLVLQESSTTSEKE